MRTPISPIKITKDMLPNLPDEVFEIFIVPLDESPLCIFDYQPEGRWHYHFGGLSIEEFNKLRWRKTTLSFNKDIFHPDSYRDMYGLIEYCCIGEEFISEARFKGYSPSSRELLPHLILSIVNTGKFNTPIVCIKTSHGIRFLDGCHRLSAAFLLNNSNPIPLDAWIGE